MLQYRQETGWNCAAVDRKLMNYAILDRKQ